ncbi:MAG: hypothetical protein K6E58_03035 [Eubacterium sp.]|nr:hypothetical protein [Eubacterium sp.]
MKKYCISFLIVVALIASLFVSNFSSSLVKGGDVNDTWNFAFLSVYVTDSNGNGDLSGKEWYDLQDGFLYLKFKLHTGEDAKSKTVHDYFSFTQYDGSLSNINQFEYKDPADNQWKDARSAYVANEHTFVADKNDYILLVRMNFSSDLAFKFKYIIDKLDGTAPLETSVRFIRIKNGKVMMAQREQYVTTEAPTTNSNYYNVANYKPAGGQITYPSQEGKVFAGWFTDDTYTMPYMDDEGYAYAKFVDEKSLSVKFQAANDGSAIRFVSTVNSLDYNQVGFRFTGTYNGATISEKTKTTDSLYTKISADGESLFPGTAFGNSDSQYFFTYTVRGMTNAKTASTWAVSPFFVTLDGTTVVGAERTYPPQS